MKNLTFVLLISLFSSLGLANISGDNKYLLNHMNSVAQKTQLGQLIDQTSGTLVAKYSYAIQGGNSTADIKLLTDLGDSKSYAVLPNKAIVRNAFVHVLTAPSAGTSTIAFKVQSAGDLLAATDRNSLQGGFYQGVPTGATTTFIRLSADRNVVMSLGSVLNSNLTAGKIDVIIDYIIGD